MVRTTSSFAKTKSSPSSIEPTKSLAAVSYEFPVHLGVIDER